MSPLAQINRSEALRAGLLLKVDLTRLDRTLLTVTCQCNLSNEKGFISSKNSGIDASRRFIEIDGPVTSAMGFG
jgi:hypothetical protein